MNEKSRYDLLLSMDHYQLRCFYMTLNKAYTSWPGGNPYEQTILKELSDQSWKLLLEAQFKG